MKKALLLALAFGFAFAWLGLSPVHACIFGENDYCVSCPDGSVKKVSHCPGGEVGVVLVGMKNSGCSVSYYNSRYCMISGMLKLPPQEDTTAEATGTGTPSKNNEARMNVTMLRGRVLVDMSVEDFERAKPGLESLAE